MSRIKDLIAEYKALGISDQIDYDKLYLYSIITHSTAIEGSTVTEIENQLLFDEEISPNRTVGEQLMNLDLKAAYEAGIALAEKHEAYSVAMLCSLSGKVLKNTGSAFNTIAGSFDSSKGELRRLNVSAGRGGRSYMAWQKVESRLEEFCTWLNKMRASLDDLDDEGVYYLSFEAHYRLVHIHPWADGNGRMARLVMNMIQYEAGAVPSIVKKESRAEYIQSLSDTRDAGDIDIFTGFMMRHHIDNISEQIDDYKASLDEYEIKDGLNDTINDTLSWDNDTLNSENEKFRLTDTQKTVYDSVKADNYITINAIVLKTGLSRPTVTRALKYLQEKEMIRRIGSRKTGHWVVITN